MARPSVWLVMLATAAVASVGSVAWTQQEAAPGDLDVVERLSSPTNAERQKAFREIGRSQGELRNALLKNLGTLGKEPDRSYGSAFHRTVMLLGRLRVENAAGPLLSFIDFRLDTATMPVGGYGGPATEYPVAQALKEIGGKRASDSIFQKLPYPVEERALTLYAWVLSDVMAREVALMVAQKKLDELEAYKRRNNMGDNPVLATQQRTLERLLQLLESDESVLRAVDGLK